MSCTKRLFHTLLLWKALLVRILYAVHASIAVLVAVIFTGNYYLAAFQIFSLISLVEYVVTLKRSKKGEWKWWLPSVMIYILWVTPPLFILEYVAKSKRMTILELRNGTAASCPTSIGDISDLLETNFTDINSVAGNDQNIKEYHDRLRQFAILLEQTMMVVFIAGRWMAPKGSMTREQLSQLLLAYVGMAADMLEFITETLKVPEVACSKYLFTIVLIIWTWSILQYTLGLTATKQRKTRVVGSATSQQDPCSVVHGCRSFLLCCCGGEIWALLVSVIMQDGPYLALRLYLLFKLEEFGQIFFTVKNGILFCLQLYRIMVVIGVMNKNKNGKQSNPDDDYDDDDVPYKLSQVSGDVKKKNGSNLDSYKGAYNSGSAI